jgi:hypothetical protein
MEALQYFEGVPRSCPVVGVVFEVTKDRQATDDMIGAVAESMYIVPRHGEAWSLSLEIIDTHKVIEKCTTCARELCRLSRLFA